MRGVEKWTGHGLFCDKRHTLVVDMVTPELIATETEDGEMQSSVRRTSTGVNWPWQRSRFDLWWRCKCCLSYCRDFSPASKTCVRSSSPAKLENSVAVSVNVGPGVAQQLGIGMDPERSNGLNRERDTAPDPRLQMPPGPDFRCAHPCPH